MNTLIKSVSKLFLLALVMGLWACGGSTDGAIEGTGGSSQSRLNLVGSISNEDDYTVNDVNYDVNDETAIIADGEIVDQSELSAGQVITVSGNVDIISETVTADNIHYVSNVVGPVASVDQVISGFVVLGQTVLVDDSTVLGNELNAFDDIAYGKTLRISGLVSSDQHIQATRIDVIDTTEYQVVGVVESIDRDAMTFSINRLKVNYADAVVENALSNGEMVRVKGSELVNNEILYVGLIERINASPGENNEFVSLEGLVTTLISQNDFSVNNFDIVANENTIIKNGSLGDFSLDARLRVEGQIVDSVVVARRITIIHTGPVSFTGSVHSEGEDVIYTIETSDSDTGLWVTLSDLDNDASLHVDRLNGDVAENECSYWTANSFSDGVCYLKNNGKTKWQIRVKGSTIKGVTNVTTRYKLTAYFRRAGFEKAKNITAGDTIQIYQHAGDRNLYHLTTSNAPKDSMLAVRVEGLQNSGQLYVQGNRQPDAGVARLFDCRLGNQIGDRVVIPKNTCWVEIEGVDSFYLSLESVKDQQYTIYTEFIVPTELTLGKKIRSTLGGKFDRLYKVNVSSDNISFGSLISNIKTANPADDNIEMLAARNVPATVYNRSCIATQKRLDDEQCILSNTGDTLWYLLIAGDEGISYDLIAHAQSVQSDERLLSIGETIHVEKQPASMIAHYRIPKGEAGKALLLGLDDNGSADFQLSMKGHPTDRRSECLARSTTTNQRICRLVSDGVGEWYVTVMSSALGSYTLWSDVQDVTELTVGEPLRDQITTSRSEWGALYSIVTPEAAKEFIVNVTDKTAGVSVIGRGGRPPTSEVHNCGARFVTTRDNGCHHKYTQPKVWYLLIGGDSDAEYTIKTEFQ